MDLRKKNLLTDSMLYFVGDIGSRFINILMLPILTRFLTVESYGVLDISLMASQIILPLMSIGTVDSIFRFLLDSTDDESKDILSTVVIVSIFTGIIVMIFMYFWFGKIIAEQKYMIFLMFLYSSMFVFSLSKGTARGIGKIREFSLGSLIVTLFSILFSVCLLKFSDLGIVSVLIGNSLGNIFGSIFIFSSLKIWNYIKMEHIKLNIFIDILKFALPMMFTNIMWWVINSSNRIFIRDIVGLYEAGIYSIAGKLSQIIVIFVSVFDKAWQTSASKEFESHDKDEYYSSIFDYFFKLQLLLTLAMSILGRIVFPIIIGKEYKESLILVTPLLLGTFFWSMALFYGTSYVASKKMKGAFYTTFFSSVLNILLNLILLKNFKLWGAVIASILTYFSLYIFRTLGTKKYVSIKINKIGNIVGFIVLILINVLNLFVENNNYFAFLGLILTMIYILIDFKEYSKIFCSVKRIIYK